MDWTPAISVISAVISTLIPILGVLGFIYKELKEEIAKVDRRLEEEIRIQNAKFEEERRIQNAKFEEERRIQNTKFEEERRIQTARSDQLYQMFMDLLKSQNPKTHP